MQRKSGTPDTQLETDKLPFAEPTISILILCTGNSCRSQMAEGWIRELGRDSVEVYSAGVESHGLNSLAVEVMKEAGVDISHHTSDRVEQYIGMNFDYVITVCDHARERCPVFPGKAKKIHHDFEDPAAKKGDKEEVLKTFRKVRDQIKDYSAEFLQEQLGLEISN